MYLLYFIFVDTAFLVCGADMPFYAPLGIGDWCYMQFKKINLENHNVTLTCIPANPRFGCHSWQTFKQNFLKANKK